MIHNYRWRLGLDGNANGAPHPEPGAYLNKFTGHYGHRLVKGGIGHNLPQEAPRAFAEAVIEAGSYGAT